MPWSSNATFLVNVTHGDDALPGDLQAGARRAAAVGLPEPGSTDARSPPTSSREAMGLRTSCRRRSCATGPFGEGSLQCFVDADFEQHYFTILRAARAAARPAAGDRRVRPLANNTDRKSGHCLLDADGKVWGIDHGLCFSAESKLRTVIWEFGGERHPARTRRCRAPRSPTACRSASPPCSTTTRSRRCAHRAERIVTPRRVPGRPLRTPLPVAAGVSDRRPRRARPTTGRPVRSRRAGAADRRPLRDARLGRAARPPRPRAARHQRPPAVAGGDAGRVPPRPAGARPSGRRGCSTRTAGRFTIGPLTEVVAAAPHVRRRCAPHLDAGPRRGVRRPRAGAARRRRATPTACRDVLDLPLALAAVGAGLRARRVPRRRRRRPTRPPVGVPHEPVGELTAAAERLDDETEITLAVRQLVESWTAASTGRAEVAAVEGDCRARSARSACAGPGRADRGGRGAGLAGVGRRQRRRPRPPARRGARPLRRLVDARRARRR